MLHGPKEPDLRPTLSSPSHLRSWSRRSRWAEAYVRDATTRARHVSLRQRDPRKLATAPHQVGYERQRGERRALPGPLSMDPGPLRVRRPDTAGHGDLRSRREGHGGPA